MAVNNTKWNKIRYTFYQPVYDSIAIIFRYYRKLSFENIQLKPKEKVLICGAGTGLDLEFMTNHNEIHAIDLTPAMLSKLEKRARKLKLQVNSQIMNGESLEYEDNTFDVVVLHLIVAVIPDPVKCLQEVERVLKPEGRFTILDKFIESGQKPGFIRKLLNTVTDFLFSAINRDIDKLLSQTRLKKTKDIKLKASYRLILGIKN